MGGYLCSCTWACTWLLVLTDPSCAHESSPGHSLSCALHTWAAGGVCREVLEPPVQRHLPQAAAGEGRLRRGHHGSVLSEQRWLSRAGWQRQDNMPWGSRAAWITSKMPYVSRHLSPPIPRLSQVTYHNRSITNIIKIPLLASK